MWIYKYTLLYVYIWIYINLCNFTFYFKGFLILLASQFHFPPPKNATMSSKSSGNRSNLCFSISALCGLYEANFYFNLSAPELFF